MDGTVAVPPVADAGGSAAAGSTSSGGAGRRGPGRPRASAVRPPAVDPVSGDFTDLINTGLGNPTDFSLTVTSMDSGNIPSHVYDQIVGYAKGCTVRFVGSQERGEEKRNLHMQCVGTWALMKTFDTPIKLNAAMRKHIRDKSGIASNDRIKIVVKPLEGKQTFTDMVGYCCKDSGKSHYKTFRKNVTKAEANTALTEYRALQRQTVKDNRVEWGKKNFWSILHRFKQENIRALTVSPQLAAQWLVNDGEYLPSYSWICPTGNSGMVSEAADAYWVALLTPKLFTRKEAYVLFFSGGYSGRTTSSFALWDNIDREFEELSVDEAKVCSHDRLRVQGAMDLARERVLSLTLALSK